MLEPDTLMRQCTVEFGRASGPGGQHRNKVETAVTITHTPTGVSASATERRHQAQNRHEAIFRLRLRLARDVRRHVDPDRHQPSELWRTRRQGEKLPINPEHRDYPALLAEALDVIIARGFDVAVMVKDYGDRVKVSLRSRGGVSAQNVAVQLGGGGHVPAAGATVSAPYAVARPQLDAAIAEELSRVSRTAPS